MEHSGDMMLYAAGIFSFSFAVFHMFFWRLFRWPQDLKKLTSLNRAVMQIMNHSLIYIFFIFAFAAFFLTESLLNTRLGMYVLIFIALFWFLRAIEQIIFFGLSRPLSILFVLLFLAGSVLHLLPLIYFNGR